MRTGFSGELHVSHDSLEIVAVPFEAKKNQDLQPKGNTMHLIRNGIHHGCYCMTERMGD
jgi:hypothetical protein